MNTALPPGRTLAFVAALVVLALASVACGGDDDPPATGTPSIPTATPTSPSTVTATPSSPTATPSPTPVPAITETGIEVIDAYLAARDDGDLAAVTALLRTHRAPCGDGEYGLVCPSGATPGTLVDAFPWGGCHGAWSNQGTLEQAAAFIVGREGDLRHVIRFAPAGQLQWLPAGVTTAAVFEEQINGAPYAWAIIVDESHVYGWLTGCGIDVPMLLDIVFPGSEVILPAP